MISQNRKWKAQIKMISKNRNWNIKRILKKEKFENINKKINLISYNYIFILQPF